MMIPTNWQGGKDYLGGGKGVNHNRPALPLRSQVVRSASNARRMLRRPLSRGSSGRPPAAHAAQGVRYEHIRLVACEWRSR
jgi:hypothetical protein